MEKKQRVPKGEPYWFVDIDGRAWDRYERNEVMDSVLFDTGNYFHTKEEAERMCKKFFAVLKGADVIQIPSRAEIFDAAGKHVEACDEEGHPYSDEYDSKAAFINGAEWLKSKTIK